MFASAEGAVAELAFVFLLRHVARLPSRGGRGVGDERHVGGGHVGGINLL